MPLMDLVGMSIREALPRWSDLRDRMGLRRPHPHRGEPASW
jgi:hypothetical protein